jgi:hypothetical protein
MLVDRKEPAFRRVGRPAVYIPYETAYQLLQNIEYQSIKQYIGLLYIQTKIRDYSCVNQKDNSSKRC